MKLPPHIVVHNSLRQYFQAYQDLSGGSFVPGFQAKEMPEWTRRSGPVWA